MSSCIKGQPCRNIKMLLIHLGHFSQQNSESALGTLSGYIMIHAHVHHSIDLISYACLCWLFVLGSEPWVVRTSAIPQVPQRVNKPQALCRRHLTFINDPINSYLYHPFTKILASTLNKLADLGLCMSHGNASLLVH